jgi:hypothetical protein
MRGVWRGHSDQKSSDMLQGGVGAKSRPVVDSNAISFCEGCPLAQAAYEYGLLLEPSKMQFLGMHLSHCITVLQKLTVKYVRSRSQRLARFLGNLTESGTAARLGGPVSGTVQARMYLLERAHIYADVNGIKHAPILFRQAPSSS